MGAISRAHRFRFWLVNYFTSGRWDSDVPNVILFTVVTHRFPPDHAVEVM